MAEEAHEPITPVEAPITTLTENAALNNSDLRDN